MNTGRIIGLLSLVIAAIYLSYKSVQAMMADDYDFDFVWLSASLLMVLVGILAMLFGHGEKKTSKSK